MLILLLFIFLSFNHPVFAIPTVIINSVPDVITAGTTFPISFTVNEASSSSSYYYKFFGGIDNDVYKITNSSDLSYSTNWINFPKINLDPSSANIFNGYAFIKPEVETNILNLKIRIALISDPTNTKLGATSPSFSIDVVAAPPLTSTPTLSPTLIPTSIPTNTPSPTKIPTPTKTLTPTLIPSPTLIITETLTPTEIITLSTTIVENLSTQDTPSKNPSPTIESVLGVTTNSNKKNYIPLIFICLGALFLLTPLIIAKIKHEN